MRATGANVVASLQTARRPQRSSPAPAGAVRRLPFAVVGRGLVPRRPLSFAVMSFHATGGPTSPTSPTNGNGAATSFGGAA